MSQTHQQARIKFCGMKRSKDVEYAVRLGVDYIGFVLVPGAKRAVEVQQVQRIQDEVDCSGVCRVGVFRDQHADDINALVQALSLDLVQLHGKEEQSLNAEISVPIIRMVPVPVTGGDALPIGLPNDDLEASNLYAILLDASRADGESGGLGVLADPQALSQACAALPAWRRFFLAGGLTPQNVRGIVEQYQPDAVDVSSGIESQPGSKDAERMRAFVDAVRGEQSR